MRLRLQLVPGLTDTRYRLVLFDRCREQHLDGKTGFEWPLQATTLDDARLEAELVVTLLEWVLGADQVEMCGTAAVRAGEV